MCAHTAVIYLKKKPTASNKLWVYYYNNSKKETTKLTADSTGFRILTFLKLIQICSWSLKEDFLYLSIVFTVNTRDATTPS